MKLFHPGFLTTLLISSIASANTIAINAVNHPEEITSSRYHDNNNLNSSKIKALQGFKAVQNIYTMNSNALKLIRHPEYIKLQLTPELSILGQRHDFYRDANGIYIWKGTVLSDHVLSDKSRANQAARIALPGVGDFAIDPMNDIELFISPDGELNGKLHLNGQLYGIQSIDANSIMSFKINEAEFPIEEDTDVMEMNYDGTLSYADGNNLFLNQETPKRTSLSTPLRANTNNKDVNRINVLLVFTKDAANDLTDQQFNSNVTLLANTLQESANNSKLPIQYTVTGIRSDIDENGMPMNNLLNYMQSNLPNPIGDYIKKNRIKYRSDIVSLITLGAKSCGLGEYLKSVNLLYGYNIVNLGCGLYNFTLPHEVGHNLGLAHDAAHSGAHPLYAYGHGYINPLHSHGDVQEGGWRTVMSYKCPDYLCESRLNIYSSPDLTYQDAALGEVDKSDNVRVLQQTSITAAAVFAKPAATFEHQLLRNPQHSVCLVSRNNKVRAKTCYVTDENQYWSMDEAGHLHNNATHTCLTISAGAEGETATVNMVSCESNPTAFTYTSQWLLQNRVDPQQVIEVKENGDLFVSAYEGGAQQQWITVDPAKMPGDMLQNSKEKTCMNSAGIYNIIMSPCDPTDINQRWMLVGNGQLKNMGGDELLCATAAYSFDFGSPLELIYCHEHEMVYWNYDRKTQNFNIVGDPRIIMGLGENNKLVLASADQGQDLANRWIRKK